MRVRFTEYIAWMNTLSFIKPKGISCEVVVVDEFFSWSLKAHQLSESRHAKGKIIVKVK